MVKNKKMRALSLGMAAMLGLSGTAGLNTASGTKINAENTKSADEKVVFSQGEGFDTEFSQDSWKFYATAKDGVTVDSKYYPKIVNDGEEGQYLGKGKNEVIRLIRGVKEGSNGIEASDSYSAYRTGEAFLKQGFQLNSDAEFSVAFTFSMPEAVVNQEQTGGAEFSREVGGDGIAFVMTTNKEHKVQAGSGIGYQGLDDSLAVELDSYFNGAYCDMKPGTFAYKNWGFDNQLYFHKGATPDGGTTYSAENPYDGDYENYVNYNNDERFDHIGVVKDGDVKKHEAIYYLNQLNPTEIKDGVYTNLRNRYYHTDADTTSAKASTSSTCTTRFADKGVDDRLFTAWVDFDGKEMKVSYASGTMSKAVKPASAQITQKIDLNKFEGKTVYMGFTSAVGSSKANHTIHSLKISIPQEKAKYALRYWLQDKKTGEYTLKETSEIFTDEVGTKVTADKVDGTFATKYDKDGYTYSQTATQKTSTSLDEADQTYYMDVYYDAVEEHAVEEHAAYKLNYYLYDRATQQYVLKDSTPVVTDKIGATHTVIEVDPAYTGKYTGYNVNSEKNETYTVTLTEANKTYEMNVYYDPYPVYAVEYYVEQPDGSYKLYKETRDITSLAGTKVSAEIITIDGYKHTTTPTTNEEDTVLADSSTVLKVYYNLDTPAPTATVEPTAEPTVTPTVKPVVPPTEETLDEEITKDPVATNEPAATKAPEVVEPTEEPTVEATLAPEEPNAAPKTGDQTNPAAWIMLMFVSLAGLVSAGYRAKKRR